MFKIISKTKIAPDIFRLEISAPLVARKFKAGPVHRFTATG